MHLLHPGCLSHRLLLVLQVFDLDSTFFGKDILDFGTFCPAPSSPSDGERPFVRAQVCSSAQRHITPAIASGY